MVDFGFAPYNNLRSDFLPIFAPLPGHIVASAFVGSPWNLRGGVGKDSDWLFSEKGDPCFFQQRRRAMRFGLSRHLRSRAATRRVTAGVVGAQRAFCRAGVISSGSSMRAALHLLRRCPTRSMP
jgi:hypothetical protein